MPAAEQIRAAPGRVRATPFKSLITSAAATKKLPAPFRARLCFAIVLTLTAALAACNTAPKLQQPAAEALPALSPESFDASIRDRVRTAYEAVKAAPNDATKNGELAMLLHAHDQFEHAEKFYLRAQTLAPGDASWTYYLGITQQRQAKHEDAIRNFRAALKLVPGDGPSRLHLAESLLAQGQLDESRELYQAVIKSNPEIADAQYGLGRVLVAQNKTDESVAYFVRACELAPNFGAAHYALALAYRDLKESDKAKQQLALYEKDRNGGPASPDPLMAEVKSLKTGAGVHLKRGVDAEKAGHIAESIEEHEKAVELDPALVQARVNLVILYGRMGNFDKAYAHYLAALKTGEAQADLHYNFGVLAVEKGRIAEAKKAFEQALNLNPHYPSAHNNLGALLENEGRRDEAIKQYRLAIENQPNYRLARFHLGRLLAQKGQPREAIAEFQKIIEPVDSETPHYLYALAAAHDLAGERPKALEYGRRAQKLAAQLGQTELAQKIEKDLKRFQR